VWQIYPLLSGDDGLNDATVLARADLGIAMGKVGAQASIETADIVLLNDRPEKLTAAFEVLRITNRLVWQNVGIAWGGINHYELWYGRA
jgi:Cd2+/Zn2+-exporting ATPase